MMITILGNYSLRTKLVLLHAVLLIFSVAFVSYYSYWSIWELLITDKSRQLRARAKPIIEHWLREQGFTEGDSMTVTLTPNSALALAHDLTSRDTVAVILNRKGEVMANGKRLPEEPVAPAFQDQYFRKAISGAKEINYFHDVNGKRVLVFLIPLKTQPGGRNIFGVIQVSTSLSDIHDILLQHVSRQISAVAIILVLGISVGYWLIGGRLRALQTLAITCQEIAQGNFSQRAHVKNQKDEIGALAGSFNVMLDKLEKLFDSQKRFVANAAHELLTPLTGLRGSLEVLLRGAQDDPETASRLSKGMHKEVNHLIRLCDRLLELSCLENTPNIRKKRIELRELMEVIERKTKHLTYTHSIIIQEGPVLTLMADPDLLEQIVLNLLSNAIRYSPPDVPITVGWGVFPDHVEVRVTDQGEGMDRETLSHAFEPFYRGNNQTMSDDKGAGLGLALTKSMVEAQGGEIRIESTPGKGTTIFFTLPLESFRIVRKPWF